MLVRQLLKDVIDFHIHPGPDPFARCADAVEIAWLARNAGMKAIVLKTSHYMGASMTTMLERYVPGIRVFGGLCLENTVGGINPRAAEIAIQCGAKVIWMPFLDCQSNAESWEWAKEEKVSSEAILKDLALHRSDQRNKITIAQNGKLIPEAKEIMDMALAANVILCTGHVNRRERALLVDYAGQIGFKKLVFQHVNATWAPVMLEELEEMKAEEGVYFEFAFNPVVPYIDNQPPHILADMIRLVGTKKAVLCTDCGISMAAKGIAWPHPVEAMAAFIGLLRLQGFSQAETDQMTKHTASYLLDI